MKDFSFWEEYEGASEGSGRSEKIWLINPDTQQTGLFKFKKDEETTDHVSECVASDLAELIGIPCAKFEIGRYRGREGSMSYNIVDQSEKILIEGVYCINLVYDSFDVEKLMDIKTGDKYSLQMIKCALDQLNLFAEFLPILVFDFLIGNTDRHQSNWALILNKGKLSISPLYDNSSSLCAYVKEERVSQYLGADYRMWNSLVDSKSRSILRIGSQEERRPTHLEMLKYLHDNFYSETKNIVAKIKTYVTEQSIYDILCKYDEVLSEDRKKLIQNYLLSKIQLLKEVYKEEDDVG